FITQLAQAHPHLQVSITADSLSAHAPHLPWRHAHDLPDLVGVKEGDHAALFEHVAAAEQTGRVTYDDRDDAETGLRHRVRFVSDGPLNEAHADLRVNCLACWEWDTDQ